MSIFSDILSAITTKGRKLQIKMGLAKDFHDSKLDVGEFGLIIDKDEVRIGLADGTTKVVGGINLDDIPIASATQDGKMSKAMVSKLNGIASEANFVQVTDSVTSTSTTSAASANAVKQAYDKAVEALNNSGEGGTGGSNTLPIATATTLGGVKIGTNINTTNGTISVNDASTNFKGVVQLNNTVTSTSTTQAVTANVAKTLADELNTLRNQINPTESNIDGTVAKAKFVEVMNKKAQSIGMINTTFVNPHGLMNSSQVTSAKDMLLMTVNAIGYKDITKSWSKKAFKINVEGNNARSIELSTTITDSSINDNYYLYGGKTGTLTGTTSNLISVVNTKNTNEWFVGCVVGATNSRYTASRQLYDISNTIIKNKIAIYQNSTNITNGNFDEGLNLWSANSGNPTLSKDDYYSFPQSLKVNSNGTSSQVRRTLSLTKGNKYYVSAMVKCTRYSAGSIGVQMTTTSPSSTFALSRVTDGWEKVSGIVTADVTSSYIYVGGLSSANLDGYVDMINVINLTTRYGSGKEPSKEEMDEKFWREVDADSAITCQVPVVPMSYNRNNLPILFEKNSEDIGYPASLTKLITAMVMLDNVSDLGQKITIISSDITEGSGATFYQGDIITFEDALYCLMLPSSNTIATAIARTVGNKLVLESQ